MAAIGGWIWRRFRPLAIAAGAGAIGYSLWDQRAAVAAVSWQPAWLAFLGAVAVFACGPLFGATAYWLLLDDLTGRARYVSCVQTWTRSFMARYVPSGALAVAVRLRARADAGASSAQVLSASALEQLAAVLGGTAAVVCAFALAGAAPPPAAPALLVCAAGVAVVTRSRRVGRRFPRFAPVRAGALGGAALLAAASWITGGTAAWLLAGAVSDGSPDPFLVVGAYGFAWLVGFLAVFVPGGLGVREAAFVALLAPQLGAGGATVLAVVLRLANVLGDLTAAAAVELGALLADARSRQCLRDV